MQDKGLSQWHWLMIGLVMGALAAYVRVQFSSVGSAEMRPGIKPAQFMALAAMQEASPGKPLLRNLVIYPAEANKNYVTGETDFAANARFQFNAPRPFVVGGITSSDIRQFLRDRYPHVSFRYAWWASPRAQAPLWALGTFVLIGIVWPTVHRARFGESKEPDGADGRTGSSSTSPAPAVVPMSNAAELDDLVAAMSADTSAVAPTGTSAQAAEPVVKLDATPLAAVESEPQVAKQYRGEFYPVSRDKSRTQRES
jgi:hypothetical protein